MAERTRTRRREGTVNTSIEKKTNGEVTSQESISKQIPQEFHNEPLGSVSIGAALTHNCGDYESIKVSVMVTLPTKTDDESIRETEQRVVGFVDEFLTEEYEAATGESIDDHGS